MPMRGQSDLTQPIAAVSPTASAARSGTKTGTKHLAGLDGLRGVAVAGVLLFHAGHFDGGFLGVDLFFALSGYLITGLLLREIHNSGTVSLVSFWGRRFRRLFPALATMLVVTTLTVWWLGAKDMWRSALSDGPWVQANLINWHLLAESAGYWDRFGATRVFEHLWSIAVEEQFYLVWPVVLLAVVWAARRMDNRWAARGVESRVAVVAALASVVSLVLMLVLYTAPDSSRVYMGTDTRTFSLMLGALLATAPMSKAFARFVGRRVVLVQTVLIGLLAVIWIAANGQDSHWLFRGGLFAHSLLAALLVLSCAQAPGSPITRVLSWKPIRGLGAISYSLYLWHWPVFVILSEDRLGMGGWARTAVLCAVSIALATASKFLVEDPIRFRVRWSRGRAGLVALILAMAALAAMWILVPMPEAPQVDV